MQKNKELCLKVSFVWLSVCVPPGGHMRLYGVNSKQMYSLLKDDMRDFRSIVPFILVVLTYLNLTDDNDAIVLEDVQEDAVPGTVRLELRRPPSPVGIWNTFFRSIPRDPPIHAYIYTFRLH
ncbi:hypothetical protein GALMADRAFT_243773 [Galerina marginata CBS 339.88]|uniref:Uncharacterized protein n=1 Tax=Galerina marginata (strain CBS 339.88) TaxID=685588 RepID=A0A067TBE9_GALM3|nr:hypothetical protein GALMADRAFT_243773 [Galerina marginata CBS 339.88]